MRLLDIVLPTIWENLALDEALLDEAEAAGEPRESLRVWEWPTPAVVIGRSSRIVEEVNLAYCEAHSIPVARRCSGGCAVVIGAGCLLYSVVLSYERHPELHILDETHRFVLLRIQKALLECGVHTSLAGTSDLSFGNRKFSGNALRCKRHHLLYHGTILYNADLGVIANCLPSPPREPAYRAQRSHSQFVTNIPFSPQDFHSRISAEFDTEKNKMREIPHEILRQLMSAKYSQNAWHRER